MAQYEKGEFEIEIRKNGEVSVRTVGIKGAGCVDAAKQFQTMLRGKEIDSQRTSEYYEGQTTGVEDVVKSYNQW
ncbi:MAG: DUF2997 domain-containing protein [Thermoguttaceae bacterium]